MLNIGHSIVQRHSVCRYILHMARFGQFQVHYIVLAAVWVVQGNIHVVTLDYRYIQAHIVHIAHRCSLVHSDRRRLHCAQVSKYERVIVQGPDMGMARKNLMINSITSNKQ